MWNVVYSAMNMLLSALYFLIIGKSEIYVAAILSKTWIYYLGNVSSDIIDHMKGFDYKDHWSKLCQQGFPDSQARVSNMKIPVLNWRLNEIQEKLEFLLEAPMSISFFLR